MFHLSVAKQHHLRQSTKKFNPEALRANLKPQDDGDEQLGDVDMSRLDAASDRALAAASDAVVATSEADVFFVWFVKHPDEC